MEPLKTQFDIGDYRFTQIKREGGLAIFEQHHKEHDRMVRYEVVKIQHQREHTWPNGVTTPAKEAYPSIGSWGKAGWTCLNRQEADALFAQLQKSPADPEADDETDSEPEET